MYTRWMIRYSEGNNLPEDSFFNDLGEWGIINLGSGVGAVAIEMLSSKNFEVSPSRWGDS